MMYTLIVLYKCKCNKLFPTYLILVVTRNIDKAHTDIGDLSLAVIWLINENSLIMIDALQAFFSQKQKKEIQMFDQCCTFFSIYVL